MIESSVTRGVRSVACAALASVFALTLAACGGGGGGSAAVDAPAQALGAIVPQSASGPMNVINANNQATVRVAVTLGATSQASDTIKVTLQDSQSDATVQAEAPAPAGAGTVDVGPLDATTLLDGPITILVEINNGAGSSGEAEMGTITKDTVAPDSPASASVVIGPSPDEQDSGGADPILDIINLSNQQSVSVQVSFGAGSNASDTGVVTLADGVSSVSSPALTAPGGAGDAWAHGLDAQALLDGNVSVTVVLSDTNGNTVTYSGSVAIKDTIVPVPAGAIVAAGASNAANILNSMNTAQAEISVTMPAGTQVTDQLRVILSSLPASVYSGFQAGPSGGGTLSFTAIDASALADGSVTVTVEILDDHFNQIWFTGTPATKDTIAGTVTSIGVASGASNPPGVINSFNVSQVWLDVTLSAETAKEDSFTVTFMDLTGGPMPFTFTDAVAGSNIVGPVDVTALKDGGIQLLTQGTDIAGNTSLGITGSAVKDTEAPDAPALVAVPAGANNPVNTINSFNQPGFVVQGSIGSAETGRTITLNFGGAFSGVTETQAAPNSATYSTSSINAQGFVDGSYPISGFTTDVNGNVSATVTATVVKDTFVATPTAAMIPAGTGNTAGYISLTSQTAATLQITFPSTSLGTDVANLTLNGGGTVNLPGQIAPQGGGSVSITGIDASTLADGTITLNGTVTDAAGNVANAGPFTFAKDTVPPAAPASCMVPAGPSNPANVINSQTALLTSVDSSFSAGADPTATIFATLSDGSLSVNTSTQPVAPGMTVSTKANSSPLADGAISISGAVTDPAGNVTAFAGTAATKDTVSPKNPTSSFVAAGPSNAQNFISAGSVTAVQVDVSFGGSSQASDQVSVILSDGSSQVQAGPLPAPAGSGIISFTGMDCSGLADGTITVQVSVTDVSQNPTSASGTPAIKDALPPPAPSSAFVSASASNGQDIINIASQNAVSVTVNYSVPLAAGDQIFVILTDGVALSQSSVFTATGGETTGVFGPLNASGLAEGTITVQVTMTEAAGNSATYNGTPATKDTVAPTTASGANVAAGASNPINAINSASQAAVSVAANFTAALTAGDQVQVTLTGGATIQSAVFTAAGGETSNTFSGINATGLADGTVTVQVAITDLAQNSTNSAGTSATKDTTAPAAPSSAYVAAGLAPPDTINGMSQFNVSVDVGFNPALAAGEQVRVALTGGTTVQSALFTATGGETSHTFGGIDASSLTDGAVTLAVTMTDAAQNSATYAGTPATKDTVTPAAPTSATVATTTTNPPGYINASSAPATTAQVVFPASYDGTETARIYLRQSGGGTFTGFTGYLTVPAGGGTVSFPGIDATVVVDGIVEVVVQWSDAAQNSGQVFISGVIKDTVAPTTASGANVAAGASNPINAINSASQAAVSVAANFTAALTAGDQVQVTLTGGATIQSAVFTAAGGETSNTFSGINATGLADGTVTVQVAITDLAQNSTNSAGTSATKDTTAPAAPSSASVAGGLAPPDFINGMSQSNVSVDVGFSPALAAGEQVQVALTGGATVQSALFTATGGETSHTFSGIDASSLTDGAVTLAVTMTDAVQNSATYAGTPATKDTVTPAAPTSATVATTTTNPPGYINASSAPATTAQVVFPASYDGTETARIYLRQSGGGTFTGFTGYLTVPAGGGTVSFPGIDATVVVDGIVEVVVQWSDAAQNSGQVFISGVIKDTVAPTTASGANVAAGASNPINAINSASQAAVSVAANFTAALTAGDQVQVTLTGGATIQSAVFTAAGGETSNTFSGINATGLADGTVTVQVAITDLAQNSTNSAGTSATKDTTAPAAPSSASVAGGLAPPDFINGMSQSNVSVDVGFSPALAAGEQVQVALTGGATVQSALFTATGGETSHTFSGIDASSLTDGAVTLAVTMTDAVQNSATYAGTPATKDTVTPAAPTSATVATTTTNPPGYINASSAPATTAQVVFPASYDGTETARIYLRQSGGGTFTGFTGYLTVPAGGGTVSFPGIDATVVVDGIVEVVVQWTDAAQNSGQVFISGVIKDTVAPTTASGNVAAGASNPVNVINAASQASVSVTANYVAALTAGDQVVVTLTGVAAVQSAPFTATGGETTGTFNGINASTLTDGGVTVQYLITDLAGNAISSNGTGATKDTTAPGSSATAFVAAGGSNPQNYINIASSGSVAVTVNFSSALTASDQVRVDLTGGATVQSSVLTATGGETSHTFTGINASGLTDGPVTLSVVVSDAAQNSATYPGTSATKDTVSPTTASSAAIAASPSNPANFINSSSQGAVAVNVTYSAALTAGDQVLVRLIVGAGTASSSTITAAGGEAGSSFNGINASGLADGNVVVQVLITEPSGNFTSTGGTSGTKDTVAPAAPSSAFVDATVNNPVNIINSASQASVSATVNFATPLNAGEQVRVDLTGGATAQSTVFTALGGETTNTFSGINASALTDGPVTVSVVMTDTSQNSATYSGTAATKDTVAPSAPTFAGVNATSLNPANYVNAASQTQVEVLISFGASSLASDQISLTITDTTPTSINYGPTGCTNGAGNLVFVNQDFSAFADGTLTVTVVVQDAAGNSATLGGNPAVKDTAAPPAPTALTIAAGTGNAAGVINTSSVSAVSLDVTWAAATAGNEAATFRITGSSGAVTLGGITPPAGGGPGTAGPLNASAVADGTVNLLCQLTDPAGNLTSFNGTSGTKDTVAPGLPASATITASQPTNPADVINAAGAPAVRVDVSFTSPDPTDTVALAVSDGSASVPGALQASAATVTFTGLVCSGLLDGPITVSATVTDAAGNSATFNNPAALKDTVAPAAPTLVAVPVGVANGADWISAATAAGATVQVTVPASYTATDTVVAAIISGSTVSSAPQNAPTGGGVMSFTGLDVSALADGPVTLSAAASDVNNNTVTANGAAAKDVAAPNALTAAHVSAGPDNSIDFITQASQAVVTVRLTFGAGSSANDRAIVTLSQGVVSASSVEVAAPAGAGNTDTPLFDASALGEGAVPMSIAMSDLAGNAALFSGTTATKDVTAPVAPVVDPVTSPTNDLSQSITGLVQVGDGVQIEGGAATVTAASESTGAFAVPVALNLGITNNLTVKAVDPAGNRSSGTTTAWDTSPLAIVQSATAPDAPFTDATSTAGTGDTGPATGGGFVDADADGDLDLFVGETGKLWTNNGSGVFTDATASTGALFVSDRAAVWSDYDNDGDLDLFLTHSTLGSYLWRNETVGLGSLTFTDATIASVAGVGTSLRGAGFFDYNLDGWIDVVVADDDGLGNELLRNNGTGSFTDIFGSGVDPTNGDPGWLVIGDVDGAGTMDVVIGDNTPSLMYRNGGTGSFTQNNGGFSASMSVSRGGLAMADVDNDGDQDIFACRGGAANANQLWLNNGSGSFTEVAATAGVDANVTAYDVVFGDFNHDGLMDIYLACNGANVLYLNQGDQVGGDGIFEFVNVAGQTGGQVNNPDDGRLASAGDIDGDGDLDVFVGNHNTADVMYRNDINSKNFLKVRVAGKGGASGGSTKDAIGTRVTIQDFATGLNVLHRWVSGGRGAGAQDPGILHFGGIIPSRPYNVTVTFPSGAVVTQGPIQAAVQPGQTLAIIEP